MKKKIHSKNILIFFLCLTFQLTTNAQNHKYFIITGNLISDSDSSNLGSIQVIKNDLPALVSNIPEKGNFRLELDYNSDYQLTFAKNGFLSKTIHVNTEIPEELNNGPKNLPHFMIRVRLFKDDQDAANLYTGNIIQQIKYSPEKNDFVRVSTIFDMQYVEKENSKTPNYNRSR